MSATLKHRIYEGIKEHFEKFEPHQEYCNSVCFEEGALFGIRLAIEMLRSDEASIREDRNFGHGMDPKDWADWLEKE